MSDCQESTLNRSLTSLIIQFSSVTQSCPTLCDPMNRSMPGLPVHHQLPEFTQTHVHRVSDAIQPSHLLSSPIPPSIRVFSSESTLHIRWPKYWSFSEAWRGHITLFFLFHQTMLFISVAWKKQRLPCGS